MSLCKKMFLPLLLIITAILLASCVTEIDASLVPSSYFDGDFDSYTYITKNGRDRDWEEDVTYLASVYRSMHPLLRDKLSEICIYNGGGSTLYDVSKGNFYNEALKNEFLDKVNELIVSIPSLSDDEIVFGMKEAVAVLRDTHSDIYPDRDQFFPFYFHPFYDVMYNRLAPKDLGRTLLCKLVAINGIELDEIFRQMEKFVSYENESTFYNNTAWYALRRKEVLQYMGVMGKDDDAAEFTFMDADGEVFNVEAIAVTNQEYQDLEIVMHSVDYDNFFRYSHPNEYYWYEYLPEENMMYVNYINCEEMENYSFSKFTSDVNNKLQEVSMVDKYVFDFRGNVGGVLPSSFKDLVSASAKHAKNVYVLIDTRTYSCGVIAAAMVKNSVSNAVMVGESAAQAPNFFAGCYEMYLPNSDITFSVSTVFNRSWPEDYEASELQPDILIYETFEDFLASYDPVLEAVKNMNNDEEENR